MKTYLAKVDKERVNRYIRLLLFPVYLLSKLMPRSKNIIVFGSAHGFYFSDNSKYLFLEMHARKTGKKLVWITKNQDVFEKLTAFNLPVAKSLSPAGIWYQLRAAVCVYAYRLTDFEPLLLGRAKKFCLFHGIPLKLLGPELDWHGSFKDKVNQLISKIFPYTYFMHADFILNPMPDYDPYYKRAFSFSKPEIVHASMPRVDYLVEDVDESFVLDKPLNDFLEKLKAFDYIISWLPTHRYQKGNSLHHHLQSILPALQHFSDFLRERNACLALKPHPIELEQIAAELALPENVLIPAFSDPYPLLKRTDLLISDYSSVVFDYYRKSNKILFYCFDLEDYTRNVGLYEPIESLFEGVELIRTFADLTAKVNVYMNTPEGCQLKYQTVENKVADLKIFQ